MSLKKKLLDSFSPLLGRHRNLKHHLHHELENKPLPEGDYFGSFLRVYKVLLRCPQIMRDRKESKQLKLFTRHCANHIEIVDSSLRKKPKG